MIYLVRNPEVAEADKLVYIPDCKSATMLQRYTLERKQLTIPNWLPQIPRDIKGFLAYMLLVVLICLSTVLFASLLGVRDDHLPNMAVFTAIAVFVLQFAIGWYRSWAAHFNHIVETFPVLGMPVKDSVALQILRQIDSDTFDKAVEVMSNHYNGIYDLSHRICREIDDYVDSARPIVEKDYTSRINSDTSPVEILSRYNHLTSSLRPLAESCLRHLSNEIELYEVNMIYM